MDILYVSHRIPFPPNKGEKTRSYHQLDFLSRRHSIDLFCFADSPEEANGRQALLKICRSVYVETLLPRSGYLRAARRFLSDLPASVSYYDSPSMHEAIKNAMSRKHYDLVFVYCSSMAQFIPLPSKLPLVIDFVDADSAKWIQYSERSSFLSSWFYAREGDSLACYEEKIAREFNLCFVATQSEARDLGGGHCRNVEVVGNGVRVPPLLDASDLPADIQRLQPYALFVGTMSYRPNVDAVQYFVEGIFPRLRQTHPNVQFVIVGRDPTPDVKKLGKVPGVIVTGSVPDVHPFLAGAAVAVAPFRIAQGVQNKVLEALVCGVPVVLTSKPAHGISDPAKQFLIIADNPADFAASVRSVLDDPLIRQRSLAAAPELQKSLAWELCLSKMETLLLALASLPQDSRSEMVSHT